MTAWRGLKVAQFGYAMNEMGDIRVDEGALLRALGPSITVIAPGELYRATVAVSADEVAELIAFEDERFDIDPRLSDAEREDHARMQVALERLLEERGCKAFSTHFDAIGEDGRFARLPFAAASSLMAKGYGFAGEGDMLTAALVRAGHVLIGDAHFTEMYAMDFPTDSVLMSHMGEGNWRIARDDRPVRLIKRPIAIGGLDDPPDVPVRVPAGAGDAGDARRPRRRVVPARGLRGGEPRRPGAARPGDAVGTLPAGRGRARLPRRLAAAGRATPPGDEPRTPRRQLARLLRAGRGRVRADRYGVRLRGGGAPFGGEARGAPSPIIE